jgi:hypothetical protein
VARQFALQYRAVLVDISINNEAGGGAKVSVSKRRASSANSWRVYPSIKEAEKVLLAFGIRGKLVEGLDHPLDLLCQLGSRETIDFLSVEVPEDVLAAHGFNV